MTQPQIELKACPTCGHAKSNHRLIFECSICAETLEKCPADFSPLISSRAEEMSTHVLMAAGGFAKWLSAQLEEANKGREFIPDSNKIADIRQLKFVYKQFLEMMKVLPLNEAEPRSSPAVAPGLLRDAIAEAVAAEILKDIPVLPHLLDLDIKRIAAGAADIAAAQGGTALDRSDLARLINMALIDYETANNSSSVCRYCDRQGEDGDYEIKHVEHRADCVFLVAKRLETQFSRGDFNSAVPSAPGGKSVKAAWAAFNSTDAGIFSSVYPQTYAELRDAIAAPSQPQGSDSQRLDWLTEMFDYVDVYSFSKDGHKTHEFWLNRFFNPNIKFPTLREAIDATISPEPAQPGAAGEAKERGEDDR